MTAPIKKANMQRELDALAFSVLLTHPNVHISKRSAKARKLDG
jgi:hypothetical protein